MSNAATVSRARPREVRMSAARGCDVPYIRWVVRESSSRRLTASAASSRDASASLNPICFQLFAYFECGIASGIWDNYIVSDDLVTKASGSNPCTWKPGSGAEFQRYTTYPNKSLHAGSRSRTTSKRRATAAARTAPARRASASSSPWSPRWWPPSEKLGRGSRDKKNEHKPRRSL